MMKNKSLIDYEYIKSMFKNTDNISIPILQRRMKLGYNIAKEAYDTLVVEEFIIEHPNGRGVATVRKK